MTRALVLVLLCGCTAADDVDDEVDPTGETGERPVEGCVRSTAELEFGQDLADVVMVDGRDVWYGTPPQGGAPYTPWQIRMHAREEVALGARLPVRVAVRDLDEDLELAVEEVTQTFLCANAGTHEGWYYGGEVHVIFEGWTLPQLEGRHIDVHVSVETPSGDVEASHDGTMVLVESEG